MKNLLRLYLNRSPCNGHLTKKAMSSMIRKLTLGTSFSGKQMHTGDLLDTLCIFSFNCCSSFSIRRSICRCISSWCRPDLCRCTDISSSFCRPLEDTMLQFRSQLPTASLQREYICELVARRVAWYIAKPVQERRRYSRLASESG